MKTLLLSSCYLDDPIYFKRTIRWVKHSQALFPGVCIDLVDNASHLTHIKTLQETVGVIVHTRDVHYKREAWVDYKYLWVPIEMYGQLLKEYDRIIYMENDLFLLSDKAVKTVLTCEGWCTPFCNRWGFPETALQVVTRGSKRYEEFMKEDPYRFNGKIGMEDALKSYLNILDLKGDRYCEYNPPQEIPEDADYAAQVGLDVKLPGGRK